MRLPAEVVAHCVSFLTSSDHAACAHVCIWFREIMLLPGSFPEVVCIWDLRHMEFATPALLRMRPRVQLKLYIRSTFPSINVSDVMTVLGSERTDKIIVAFLLNQTRVRHIMFAGDVITDVERLFLVCAVHITRDTPLIAFVEKSYHFTECRRFDVATRDISSALCAVASPLVSTSTYIRYLLADIPHLRTLWLAEFSAKNWELLRHCASTLTELRVDNVKSSVTTTSGNFARHILKMLTCLDTLALPDVGNWTTMLWQYEKNLKSLEIRDIVDCGPLPFETERLTHLVLHAPAIHLTNLFAKFPNIVHAQVTIRGTVVPLDNTTQKVLTIFGLLRLFFPILDERPSYDCDFRLYCAVTS
jgi:hypothetical protein